MTWIAIVAGLCFVDSENALSKADMAVLEINEKRIRRELDEQEARIGQCQAALLPNKRTRAKKADVQATLREIRSALRNCEDKASHPIVTIPSLRIDLEAGGYMNRPVVGRLNVGSVGTLNLPMRVLQIIDKNNMRVELLGDKDIWIRGVPTNGLADGDRSKISQTLMVSGTKTYPTASGSLRTVSLLESVEIHSDLIAAQLIPKFERDLRFLDRVSKNVTVTIDAEQKREKAVEADKNASHLRAMLCNSASLAKAGNMDAAVRLLQRVIAEGGDAKEVAEAKRLLVELGDTSDRKP